MKSHVLLLALVLVITLLLATADEDTPAAAMKISTHAFSERRPIPERFTADGKNANPPLVVSGVPKEAKSLVLIVDDPDAPMGAWTHWIVWNMNPGTTAISEDSVPRGAVVGDRGISEGTDIRGGVIRRGGSAEPVGAGGEVRADIAPRHSVRDRLRAA